MYIYIYIYYIYIIYLYLYLDLSLSIYICIAIVCDQEITHASYTICRDKIYIKLYGLFLWMGYNCLKDKQSYYKEIV